MLEMTNKDPEQRPDASSLLIKFTKDNSQVIWLFPLFTCYCYGPNTATVML